MNSRTIMGAIVVVSAAAGSACGSDSTSPPVVQSTTYVSTLTGANERPTPNASTATGTGTYVLTGNSLAYTVVVSGLSGPATNSHIHVGGPNVTGNPIVGYVTAAVASGTVTSGTIDLTQPIVAGNSTITGDSMKVLLNNGNAYTNVHTAMFGGGEIRGQIIKR